ncbi:MAG: PSD1 and planctomycete cytochrome C domain-containing protein [Isosphaeraceae bacterium]
MRRLSATLAAAALLAGLEVSGLAADAGAKAPSAEDARFFETKIRPVLAEHCIKCHGPEKQKSHLRLDTRAAALAGGDQGPAVVPGKASESPLVTAVTHEDDALKMPPSRKLPPAVVADLKRWVEIGAPWPGPGGEEKPAATASAEPAGGTRRGAFQIRDTDRAHWAFQPVKRPAVPAASLPGWGGNPIDAFILQGLAAKGLTPNPPAAKHELIRRVTFDLTGLPPTPAEVEAFVADDSPLAYERLVDRLLDSPRYGEKWARHWLDLVRFAETNSYERDNPKPSAWRYRDYVIRSLNADKPYDRFVREQLAGDELPDGGIDGLVATGFYRLGIWDDEPTDREQAVFDGLDDVVATTGQVFLGLTVDCARCHDHKIDPISQADYYGLVAFVRNINHFRNGGPTDEAPLLADARARAEHEARERDLKARQVDLLEKITTIENELHANAGGKTADVRALIRSRGEELLGKERLKLYQSLRQELRALETNRPAGETALVVTEAGPVAPETFVLMRGNPHVQGPKVGPGFLSVLNPPAPAIPTPPPGSKTTGRRTVLADWIASPTNPLTARVMANRVWQHHFGRGIVRSPSNFGLQGDRPTHPQLLDWLASEFVAGGWRLKPLHRLIVTSSAYRMSSRANPEGLAKDPTNDLLWRFDMRRLSGEEVRDAVLAVSGDLNPAMYGPGVYPEIPREVMAGQSQPGKGWGRSSPAEQARRSVYVHVKRSLLLPILEGFDLAETDRSSPVRFSTTQPTQALAMLNGKFLNAQADRLAARLRREAGPEPEAQVRLALRLVAGREPSADEVKKGLGLIDEFRRSEGLPESESLALYCLGVLNLNEFLYLD